MSPHPRELPPQRGLHQSHRLQLLVPQGRWLVQVFHARRPARRQRLHECHRPHITELQGQLRWPLAQWHNRQQHKIQCTRTHERRQVHRIQRTHERRQVRRAQLRRLRRKIRLTHERPWALRAPARTARLLPLHELGLLHKFRHMVAQGQQRQLLAMAAAQARTVRRGRLLPLVLHAPLLAMAAAQARMVGRGRLPMGVREQRPMVALGQAHMGQRGPARHMHARRLSTCRGVRSRGSG